MSDIRRDKAGFERLNYNENRPANIQVTAVQSQPLPDNWPAMTLISVSSLVIVNHLPPEATNEGKEMEFLVISTTTGGTLTLKDLSGNTVVATAAIGAYAKAVCVKGVWRGFKVTLG